MPCYYTSIVKRNTKQLTAFFFFIENERVAFWGGRSIGICLLSDLIQGNVIGTERVLDNWITTTSFAYEDSTALYCLTAHNVVLKVEAETGKVQKKYACDEKSILYSGALKPLSDGNSVLVASGTVLGGVVVWDLRSGAIKHNFTSHEGSIFGLAFSNDASKLVSCSDDRSIRLWNLDTGEHLATGWGHLARIWDLHFYGNDRIVSVSEDCTARVWNVTGDVLETSEVLEGHLGRNVWCGAIDYENDVLATGGGDGRVRLWDLERKTCIDKHREVISLKDSERDCGPPLNNSEIFKNYTQLNGSMLVATSEGRVMVLGSNNKFRELVLPGAKVDTYLIIKGWEDIGVAAIASRDGQVYLAHASSNDTVVVLQNDLQAKLTDILVWSFESKYYVLAQSQNPKDPFIVSKLSLVDNVLSLEAQYKLEPPSTFLSTSAAMYNEATLFFGSRHGGLSVYSLDESPEPINCWRHVTFSSDSITSLIFRKGVLHFTDRGGQFAVAAISKTEEGQFALSIVSSNKLQRGSIEGSIFANGQKLLYGFRNDLFFIWNETKQSEVANEKCGGPHRAWQLTLSESDESHYRLIYTKASKVVLVSSDCLKNKFNTRLIQDGTHGREIRDIAFSPNLYPFGRIVATVSEDTCINLATIDYESSLKNHCTLRKHISGLQKLRWSHDGTYLYSSAAREEFVVWKVSLTPSKDVYAAPVATLPTSSANPDLRIMNFSVSQINNHLSLVVTIYSDSAIRIWVLDNTGYSFTQIGNGYYRTCCLLNVNLIVTGSFAHLLISATDGYVSSWDVTSILKNVGISVDTRLSADQISEAPVASLSKPSIHLQIHQSSVKDSILFGPYENEVYYHVSGGDDNSITLAKINFSNEAAQNILCIPSAHSSTITGISVVSKESPTFVTVGVDQNVKLWTIPSSWDSIELIHERYTTVADTGALDVAAFSNDKVGIMIGGSGLSFWTIK